MMHLLKRVRWNYVYLSRKTTRIYRQPKKQMQTDRSRVISFFLKKKLTCTNIPMRRKDRRRGHAAPPEGNAVLISCKDFTTSSWSSVLYPNSISDETHQAFCTSGLCTGSPLIDSKDSTLSKYRG